MTHEQEHQPTREPQHFVSAPSEKTPSRPTASDAWQTVETALAGTRVPRLPQIVAVLEDDKKGALARRLKDLVSVVSGQEMLEIGDNVGAPFEDALAASLAVQIVELSPAQLRATLMRAGSPFGGRQIDPGMLSEGTVAKVKERFGGLSFLAALPGYATHSYFTTITVHEGFVRWFITSTPAGVVAEIASRVGDGILADMLNRDVALWGWVTQVRLGAASEPLAQMHLACKHPVPKQTLANRLGATAALVGDQKGREAFHLAHAGDPAKVMASGTATRDEIFDAIANAGGLATAPDRAQLMKELVRLRAGADDILAATHAAGIGSVAAFELLLAAHDVTPSHLVTFLGGVDGLEVLLNARAMREARKRIPGLSFQDVAGNGLRDQHQKLLDQEPLRLWFFESATPQQLLWFSTNNVAVSRNTIRFVSQRFPDWSWVRELTPSENKQQLRALALGCNHAATETFIRGALLGDAKTYSDGKVDEGAEPIDPTTRSGAGTRFLDALDSGNVFERLLDLDESTRLAFGRSEGSARLICDALASVEFPRAARLLDLTFRQTIKLSPLASVDTVGSRIVSYLRSRPAAEETAAIADPSVFSDAATRVNRNLLVVFPSLAQPTVLAKALAKTPELLRLLLDGSDPNAVMDLVSREPVFSAAKPILEAEPALLDRVPAQKHLAKRGREAMQRIERDEDLAADSREPDEDVAKEGRKFHRADAKASLADGIDALVKAHGSSISALALLESHRSELVALLADATNGARVRALAQLIDLPPHVAIPHLGVAQLIELPSSRRWFYELADATVLLHLLTPQTRAHVAGNLTAGTLGAREWLKRLPIGRGLTDTEERGLDALRPLVRTSDALRDVFYVRFGATAPPEYDLKTVDSLYDAVSRVPSAHLQQGRIESITQGKMNDADAKWHGNSIEMGDNISLAETSKQHPLENWYSRADIMRLYGYDEAMITAQLTAKRLETRVEKGVEQFRMKEQNPQKFTRVVLHEVGHAVDDMLGNKTHPVWEHAKWREYNSGEFDLWAKEMGGWDRVREADKPKIRQAWVDSMRSSIAVRDLVAPDHPALSKEYDQAGVQVVRVARNEKFPAYYARVAVGDRVFIANEAYFGGFYSLQADAARSAPSHFSLYAPAEYFAECYAEYYGEVDGTPGSRSKRGGGLPSPVKRWFDENVDTLKYDPRRFKDA